MNSSRCMWLMNYATENSLMSILIQSRITDFIFCVYYEGPLFTLRYINNLKEILALLNKE